MYKHATDKMIYPLPVMGYLSGRKQKINTQTYACEKNDLFMLAFRWGETEKSKIYY